MLTDNVVVLRPPDGVIRDKVVRDASAIVFDGYALDDVERSAVAGLFESHLASWIELTDRVASCLAERSAVRRRLARHFSEHSPCSFPGCDALGAMYSRLLELDKAIERGIRQLRNGAV